jgi:hypothetical protein
MTMCKEVAVVYLRYRPVIVLGGLKKSISKLEISGLDTEIRIWDIPNMER